MLPLLGLSKTMSTSILLLTPSFSVRLSTG
ncbi:uncharacterized protein CCOS01_01287 [Colletotrichum costaricense]|uniref:Uncharacterized protein n=1 Tax=Colletotrichum costaricense TaxID=1209916 RepID=A0AAJ0E8T8_9PEZI|nr:uncharacterized protein CCOS01_01287 [Colletotrichum costaricense]KAK1539973.1 hypothetical protein CCOS01_01287 [Colletotrichum costaricense]